MLSTSKMNKCGTLNLQGMPKSITKPNLFVDIFVILNVPWGNQGYDLSRFKDFPAFI